MENQSDDLDAKKVDTSQFQTEAPPLSTAPANTRPNEVADMDANADNGASQDAVLESNGATAAAQATPGESHSQGAPPHNRER